MSNNGKTSTFVIHHDRCQPAKWTPEDVLAFAKFVRSGDMVHAATLARLGMQLVASEHHVPKGGLLQEIGFVIADPIDNQIAGATDDLDELCDGQDITAIARVYRGPTEYVIAIPIGDGDGNFEGYEYEIKPTEAEAEDYVASLRECDPADGAAKAKGDDAKPNEDA
jgi:hypothetical protein